MARTHLPPAELVGGKGARLVWLARHGFDIPRTWLIDARPFEEMVSRRLPHGHDPRSLLELVGQPESLERMAAARELILREPLDERLVQDLAELWREVEPIAPWGLAVRSSATCEDVELTAMAGLASTVLGVRGPEALEQALRKVWSSAVLPRALSHLASRGLRDISMAVVLQVVVRAEASGVMFTRPPPGTDERQWAPDECLVNATLGLGAPIVNGAAAPDMVRFELRSGTVRGQTIAAKSRALVVGDQGPEYVEVPAAKGYEPALGPQVLEQLASVADSLHRVENTAHDVEFAVEDGHVYLVQARPVVGAGYPEGGDAETVWSRANVGEALPGAATPLTWAIARGFSERGFRQAFGSLGCKVPDGVTLVANVHGRFYLNLTAFMRIASQVPLLNPRALLSVGGGDGAAVLENQIGKVSHAGFYLRLPWTVSRLIGEQATLNQRVEWFDRRARRAYRRLRKMNLGTLSNRQLAALLRQARAELDQTGTLMLACASASLGSHLVLKTVLAWMFPGEAERLAQTLTSGVDLESARPGITIARIARLARQHWSVAQGIVQGKYKHVQELPPGVVRKGLEQFFHDYGDRAVREAELATPRWSEDQSAVFAMLAAAIRNPSEHPEDAPAKARARALREMLDLELRMNRVQTLLIRQLVAHTQRTTRLRERMRAWVTRTLGSIRRVAMEVDNRLVREHPELEPGSVFFCTCDELLESLASSNTDLAHIVQLRKAEHLRDSARPDPPVTFVGSPPPVVLPPAGGTMMYGLPASAGVVEGPVRVLDSGRELASGIQPGEILVARTTDVGLTPLFLLATGVVTELGGPLSHAALVAREYGVPAVVNVQGATVALRTGDRVRIDGSRGTVERLQQRDT